MLGSLQGSRGLGLAAFALIACGAKGAPVQPATSMLVPSASVTSAARTRASDASGAALEPRVATACDGLYFLDPNEKDECALRGPWLVCFGADEVALPVAGSSGVLEPIAPGVLAAGAHPFTLAPPSGAKGAWTLRTPSGHVLTRHDDPYLGSIEEHLPGRAFVRLDPAKYAASRAVEAAYTSDVITITDAILATVDMDHRGKRRCNRVMFLADPTWNRSIPLGPATPAPTAGLLGVRTFVLLDLDRECTEPINPREKLPLHGAYGGARLVADAQGEPLGLTLEGYQYAETFVARGAKRDVVERVLATAAKAIARQAE